MIGCDPDASEEKKLRHIFFFFQATLFCLYIRWFIVYIRAVSKSKLCMLLFCSFCKMFFFFYFAFASPAAAEDSLAVFCNLASQAYTEALRKTNAHQAFSACSSLSFELHSWPFYFTLRCSLINVSVVNENDIAGIWTT